MSSERPIYHRTEVLAELRREYTWRKRLYPGWVQQGKMTAEQSRRQMQILDQVIQDYARQDGSDLFAVRLAAAVAAREVVGMVANGISGKITPEECHDRVAERIARAIKEGK